MPLDDSRPSRFQRPAPVPAVADEDRSDEHRCDPAIDPQLLAELRQQIADIDAGREPLGLPWPEARRLIFAPPTPEEMAEIEEYAVARARR